MISQMFRTEGMPGFYRGFGSIMLTVIPANMCYFSGYEIGKRVTPPNMGLASDVTTAAIAQGIAGLVYCPIDIVKQTVQTASLMGRPGETGHVSVLDAARSIWTHNGLRGFFRGFVTMNALWMPWNLIYIPSYEACKRSWYYHYLDLHHEKVAVSVSRGNIVSEADPPMQKLLPLWAFPLCSSVCAATAAICTHPIDVIKTRLQVLSVTDPGKRYKAFPVAGYLLRKEGLGGFARGLGARVVTMAAGSSVSWFAYELVKRKLLELDAPEA
ncbi:hypothetical protein QBZ16_003701 [Prototheca wickerhamii]|uniref:Mitochondrial carrier protein n=1 Tax=Prototheca wickerhamii TaxID=3111 RepID=A0AAD9II31_PROWI|nr:hypothetical protein QBZ16_003701 [Prototheca wickerhamii]